MVGSALNKLKSRSEMDPGFLRKIFNQYDVDKSGALDRGEFRQALASLGCKLMPKEFDALFNHFDPNKSGMIDYGELMWGCFNTEGLLKKWRNRTRGKSVAEIKQIFYNYLSFGDRLSPRQLQKVMAEHFHADLDSEHEIGAIDRALRDECVGRNAQLGRDLPPHGRRGHSGRREQRQPGQHVTQLT